MKKTHNQSWEKHRNIRNNNLSSKNKNTGKNSKQLFSDGWKTLKEIKQKRVSSK